MKYTYKLIFVMALIIVSAGCSNPKKETTNVKEIKDTEYTDEMLCQAKNLEIKSNKNINVIITTKDKNKNPKKAYTVEEINKSSYENKIVKTLDEGVFLATGVCDGDKKIDTWKLEFSSNNKKFTKEGYTNLAFFDDLNLKPGKYQVYGYYSFDGKKWYINDELEFSVINNTNNLSKDTKNKSGEIFIEAETGNLHNAGQYSHIADTNRAGEKVKEVYLGDGGANIDYVVKAPSESTFELFIRLTDDGAHKDNTRNATFSINGNDIKYIHKSEDTKGWKWYSLGNVNLNKGENTMTITKDKSTPAAFIIDAFKFVK